MANNGVEVLPVPIGRELRQAGREDCHPIPDFEIPSGFEWNGPMCDTARTEIGMRDPDFRWFIEVGSVEPLATIDGPYHAEIRKRAGGPQSFETTLERRLTGIEPGEIQDAIDELAEVRDE